VGDPSTRHRLLITLVLVAVLALSGRLVWVQGLDASARAEEAIAQRTVSRSIPALRGDITDRNGTVLASSMTCGSTRPRSTTISRTRRPPRSPG
jgi:cell division protein FtsI (penicillin-binding protein 3)